MTLYYIFSHMVLNENSKSGIMLGLGGRRRGRVRGKEVALPVSRQLSSGSLIAHKF
jgi:hypothetical protein